MFQNSEPLPFESYPGQGRILLGRPKRTDNCRHGYGLEFMQLTGQRTCAYCGIDLTARYELWLMMALDHVVPGSVCAAWNLSRDWEEDYSNRVLCCSACNTFDNRYTPKLIQCPTTLEEFFQVRDAIFVERRKRIEEKHKQEHTFFDQQVQNKL